MGAQVLEAAFSAQQGGVQIVARGQTYDVAFDHSPGAPIVALQTNCRTGYQREVCRGPPPLLATVPAHHGAPHHGGGLFSGGAPHPDAAPGCTERVSFTYVDSADYGAVTQWVVLSAGEYNPSDDCMITCEPLGTDGPVVRLPCMATCVFRRDVIERCFTTSGPKCPLCGHVYDMAGPQPSGSLTICESPQDCAGHPGVGSIELRYSFPSGMQGSRHQNPGNPYSGRNQTAYLPNNEAGQRSVLLLKKVFEVGKMFRVGDSVTTGKKDHVVYGGVHIKTRRSGGATEHGWPDATHHERLASECAAQGVTL